MFPVTLPLDLRLLDANFNILRRLRYVEPEKEVAILGVDDQTLPGFPEPFPCGARILVTPPGTSGGQSCGRRAGRRTPGSQARIRSTGIRWTVAERI